MLKKNEINLMLEPKLNIVSERVLKMTVAQFEGRSWRLRLIKPHRWYEERGSDLSLSFCGKI
jgi:hypothetical protein